MTKGKNDHINFLAYISNSRENFQAALGVCEEEFGYLSSLDEVFLEGMGKPIPEEFSVHAGLYMFSHGLFYETWEALFSGNQMRALMAMRSAIDATLTNYTLIDKPEKLSEYVGGGKYFYNIKNMVANESKGGRMLLASRLVKMHELCSNMCHADPDALATRIIVDGQKFYASYVPLAKEPHMLLYWLYVALVAFCDMLKIHGEFLKLISAVDWAWFSKLEVVSELAEERLGEIESLMNSD